MSEPTTGIPRRRQATDRRRPDHLAPRHPDLRGQALAGGVNDVHAAVRCGDGAGDSRAAWRDRGCCLRKTGSQALLNSLGLLFIAAMATGILTGISQVLLAKLGQSGLAQLREEVFESAMELPQERLERAGSGDLISRVSRDVDATNEAIGGILPTFISALFTIALTLLASAYLTGGSPPSPCCVFRSTPWRCVPSCAAVVLSTGRCAWRRPNVASTCLRPPAVRTPSGRWVRRSTTCPLSLPPAAAPFV